MDELRQRCLAVASRFLRVREDAEDVAQEAALRVIRARSNGSAVHDEAAFGTRVTARLAIDRVRALAHRRATRLEAATHVEAPPPAEAMPDEVARLYAAIAKLPPKQSAVVTLRKLCEMDYADIAALMGISQESCRSHCRLGLQRLREMLKESGET